MNIQQGWQCPVCGKVYAPFVRECDMQSHYGNEMGDTKPLKFEPFILIPKNWDFQPIDTSDTIVAKEDSKLRIGKIGRLKSSNKKVIKEEITPPGFAE